MTITTPRLRRRRRSLLIAGLCLLVLLGVGYFVFYPAWTGSRHWQAAQEALDDLDFPRASDQLQQYLTVHPGNAEAHFVLARTLRRAGDYARASRHLARAARLDWIPELIELERQLQEVQQNGVRGETGDRLKMYARARHPEEKVILEALFKSDRGTLNMNQATVWLNLWIDRYPDDWIPRFWRGEILESFGHLKEASADFQRLRELKPEYDEAVLRLGLIALADRGRYADARRHLDRYLAKHPDDPRALLGLARCQKGLGELDAAAATARRILDKQPGHGEAALLLGSVEAERGRFAEAVPWLKVAEASGVDARTTAYELSQILRRLGKTAEAEVQEEKFKKIDAASRILEKTLKAMLDEPRNPALRFRMGTAHLTLGREEQALKWFLSALNEDPTYKPAHRALAEYYGRRQDPESARLAAFHRRQAD